MKKKQQKEHLNLDGLKKIRQKKSVMNTGRIINTEDNFSAAEPSVTYISR